VEELVTPHIATTNTIQIRVVLINSSQKYLTKTKVITSAFKRSPSLISTGMSYSTSTGSCWKRVAAVSTTSCTTSRAASLVSATRPTITTTARGHPPSSAVIARLSPQPPGAGLPLTLNMVADTGNSSASGNPVLQLANGGGLLDACVKAKEPSSLEVTSKPLKPKRWRQGSARRPAAWLLGRSRSSTNSWRRTTTPL
jgi:hypothetical protein